MGSNGLIVQAFLNEVIVNNTVSPEDTGLEVIVIGMVDIEFVEVLLYDQTGKLISNYNLDQFVSGLYYGALRTFYKFHISDETAAVAVLVEGVLEEFLSFAGIITAVDGPLIGRESTMITLDPSGPGFSLQRVGEGVYSNSFQAWEVHTNGTLGIPNLNQQFYLMSIDSVTGARVVQIPDGPTFALFNRSVDFYTAQSICQNSNGELGAISREEEQHALLGSLLFTRDERLDVWIGASRDPLLINETLSPLRFKWFETLEGSSILEQNDTKWLVGEPNDFFSGCQGSLCCFIQLCIAFSDDCCTSDLWKEDCVEWEVSPTSDGFNDRPCFLSGTHFLCSIKSISTSSPSPQLIEELSAGGLVFLAIIGTVSLALGFAAAFAPFRAGFEKPRRVEVPKENDFSSNLHDDSKPSYQEAIENLDAEEIENML